MATRAQFLAFCLISLMFGTGGALSAAPMIEVVAKTAKVKVDKETIATLEKGQKVTMIKTQGGWVAVRVGEGEAAKLGWVLASDVKVLPDPAINDESAAPPVPVDVRASIDLTQFTQAWGPQSAMYFRVSLANESPDEIDFKVADLELKVEDEKLPPVDRNNFNHIPVYTDSSMRAQVNASALNFLKDTKLAAGTSIDGWLGFNVAGLQQLMFTPGAIAAKSWIFEGKVGPIPIRIDLKETETKLIADKLRESTLDASVNVIEVGSRINALNAGKVFELLKSLPAESQGCVMVLTDKECIVDGMATQQFQQQMYQIFPQGNQPVLVKETPTQPVWGYGYQGYFHYGQMQHVPSEETGTLTILGRRPNTGAALMKYLDNEKSDIRAQAARSLTNHLGEAGVVNALAKTAADPDGNVRVAAVGALGGNASVGPNSRQNGSVDTLALVKALADPLPAVRLAAAQAAFSFQCDQVRKALIPILDDPDFATKFAAVNSVGNLQVKDAVPKLKELQADANAQLKTGAIDALVKIGELTPLEGAVAKLDNGQLQDADFQALGQARDKRAVQPLLAMLKVENNYQTNLVARTLGQIGDTRAVEPLLRTFLFGNRNFGMEELPRALGKLGDRRAIEPLQQCLQVPNQNMQAELRGAIFEALLQLKAPSALDEAAEELKKMMAANRQWEARPILLALGRSRDPKAVSILAPFLDDQQACIPACTGLFLLGTKAAHLVLEDKLNSADYQWGQMVLINQQWPRTASAVALLTRIRASKNDNTRMGAEQALNNLQAAGRETSGASGPSPIGYLAPTLDGDNDVEGWLDGRIPADLKGKVTLILLPDTSGSEPDLQADANKYLEEFERRGLAVVALWKVAGWDWDAQNKSLVINPNSSPEMEQRAIGELVQQRGIKYRIAMVSAASGLTDKFGGPAGNRVALVDRAGVLQSVRQASDEDLDSPEFEALISELLDESPTSQRAVRVGRQIPTPPDVPKLPRSALLAYAASRFDPDGSCSTIPAHHDTVWSVRFAPDGKSIATTSGDGTARLWDLSTGKLRHTLSEHQGLVRHCVFNRDGTKLLTGGFDRTIRMWDVESGTLEKTLNDDAQVYYLSLLDGDQTLVSASQDSRLRMWNLADGQIKRYFVGHTGTAWTVAASSAAPGKSIIASGSVDRTLRVWDTASEKPRHVLSGPLQQVNAVAVSNNGQTVAAGAGDVILWNATTGQEILKIPGPESFVYDLAFSPDQKTLAVGRSNHTVTLYEVPTGKVLKQWNRGGWCVSFSKDGKQLASGSDDRTVRIWRLK